MVISHIVNTMENNMNKSQFKMALATALMLTLAGCSSTGVANKQASATEAQDVESQGEQVAQADKSNLVCYQEKTIGSNRKTLRCMTKEDRERAREVSREAWLRQQQGSETGGGDTGGK